MILIFNTIFIYLKKQFVIIIMILLFINVIDKITTKLMFNFVKNLTKILINYNCSKKNNLDNLKN